jgi:hypothetical protein
MAEILPWNGLQSTLTGALTSASTTLAIQPTDAPIWPTGGEYRAVLCTDPNNGPWELVKVISGQGSANLGVTRAVESYNGDQTAKAWPSGTYIAAVVTHDSLQLAAGTQGYTVHEEFLPANGATTVTLSTNPAQGIGVVSRNGVVQSTTDGHYTQAGTTLTFSTAFSGTERVVVSYTVGTTGAQGPPGAGITWPLLSPVASTPQYAVSNDTTTGIYGNGSGSLVIAAGGVQMASFGPQIILTTSPATGWRITSGNLLPLQDQAFNIGAAPARVNNIYVGTQILAANMLVSQPAYAFGSSTSTGMYSPATGQIALAAAGVAVLNATSSLFYINVPTGIILGASNSAYLNVGSNVGTTLSGTSQWAISVGSNFSAAATVAMYGLSINVGTVDATFTVGTITTVYIRSPYVGVGVNVSGTTYGLRVDNQGTSTVGNTYGVYIANQSGATTTNIGLFNAGTSQFNGNVTLGTNVNLTQDQATPANAYLGRTGIMGGTDPIYALRVNGNTFFNGTIGGFPSMSTSGSGTFGGPVTAQYFVTDGNYRGGSLNIDRNNLNDGTTTQPWVSFGASSGEGIGSKRTSGGNQYGLDFYTANVVRWQMNSTGQIGVGTTPTTSTGFGVGPGNLQGTTQYFGIFGGSFTSAATAAGVALLVGVNTGSGTFTMANGYALQVASPGLGAGTTVTLLSGVYVGNQGSASVVNAYGIYIAAQSGATTTNIGLMNMAAYGSPLYIGSTNALVRNPVNASQALSLETRTSYAFLCAALNSHVTSNLYWDGSNWLCINTANPGSYLGVSAASVSWQTAPAATGAVAFTQRFGVDSSGNGTFGGTVTASNGGFYFVSGYYWNWDGSAVHTNGHVCSGGNVYMQNNYGIWISWNGYIQFSHSIWMNGPTIYFNNNGGVYWNWDGSYMYTPNAIHTGGNVYMNGSTIYFANNGGYYWNWQGEMYCPNQVHGGAAIIAEGALYAGGTGGTSIVYAAVQQFPTNQGYVLYGATGAVANSNCSSLYMTSSLMQFLINNGPFRFYNYPGAYTDMTPLAGYGAMGASMQFSNNIVAPTFQPSGNSNGWLGSSGRGGASSNELGVTAHLYVVGTVYCTNVSQSSSRAVKKDMVALTPSGAMSLVVHERAHPFYFEYIEPDVEGSVRQDAKRIGFAAEDMAEIVPQSVILTSGKPSGIDYGSLVPILWGALQDANNRLKKLEERQAA